MLKLVHKDLLAGRWFWFASSVLYILYIVQPLGSSVLLLAFGAMLLLANLSIPLYLEDKDKTEILYASLPLRRADIVRGRYLLAGFLLAGSGLLIFGTAAAVRALFHAQAYQESLSPLLTPEGVAGYVLGGSFLFAAFLPLYSRLGLGRGCLVFYPGLLVLMAAAAGLERFASITMHIIPPLFTPAFLKDPGLGIIAGLGSLHSALGTPLFGLSVFALLAVSAVVSLRLSIRFYERREF